MAQIRSLLVVALAPRLLLPTLAAGQRPDSTAAAPPAHAAAALSPLRGLVHRTRLNNGLDVVVVANSSVPIATVLLAVRNGGFTQDSSDQGLSHLYEHVLFRSYPGGETGFGKDLARLGSGGARGETIFEVVLYCVEVPAEHVEGAIEVVARLLERPEFSQADLDAERPVVLDELHRYASDPEGEFERHVERALWGHSWSRKDLGGDSGSLAGVSLDRLQAIYARYYVPNNAALIVTGDVASDQIFEQARREFGNWLPGPDPFADRPIPAVAPLRTSTAVVVAHDVLDVTLRIALQGPSIGTDATATYAADVLFDVLNDPTSAFQRRLVESGLCQSVSASYTPLNHTGPIEFVAKTTPERAAEALTALVGELDNLDLLQDITAEDLAIARQRRRVQMALTLERTATLASEVAAWWASGGIDYHLAYEQRMSALSLGDVARFARDYIASSPRVIGVLAPPATSERIATWLRMGGRPNTP